MAEKAGDVEGRERPWVAVQLARGLTDKLDVIAARERRSRQFMAAEFVAEGVKRYWRGRRAEAPEPTPTPEPKPTESTGTDGC